MNEDEDLDTRYRKLTADVPEFLQRCHGLLEEPEHTVGPFHPQGRSLRWPNSVPCRLSEAPNLSRFRHTSTVARASLRSLII